MIARLVLPSSADVFPLATFRQGPFIVALKLSQAFPGIFDLCFSRRLLGLWLVLCHVCKLTVARNLLGDHGTHLIIGCLITHHVANLSDISSALKKIFGLVDSRVGELLANLAVSLHVEREVGNAGV